MKWCRKAELRRRPILRLTAETGDVLHMLVFSIPKDAITRRSCRQGSYWRHHDGTIGSIVYLHDYHEAGDGHVLVTRCSRGMERVNEHREHEAMEGVH